MIGNDIVDLADPETGVEQLNPRFDSRILTDDELCRLKASNKPHALRWSLWAAKEASYKRGRKLLPDLVFSPRQFATNPAGNGHLLVRHPRFSSSVQIKCRHQHIHAVAQAQQDCDEDQAQAFADSKIAVLKLKHAAAGKPSQDIRRFARHCLASHLRLDPAQLHIKSDQKIPYLAGPDQQILGDLSLSHHGRFLALAFQHSRTS